MCNFAYKFSAKGGEPLLHPQFKKLLSILKNYSRKGEFVTITTNGTFLSDEWLDFLRSLEFPELRISISLDSVDPDRHNSFRHYSHAYEKAVQAIKLATGKTNIKCIVRATIQEDQLKEIEAMAELVESLGADILSISSIIPVGSARNKPELYFSKNSKKKLIELVVALRKKYHRLTIDVNDPLSYINTAYMENCGEYGGCIAGIGTFSVEPDGSMLLCPVLPNQVIMNIRGMSPEQMQEAYSNSQFVHFLLERKLTGKCGGCDLRFTCGGCRARAEGILGSYLTEDPDCWL
jgi:radical SAM protein with 4Fe4S-binding SPASM domain